MKKNIFKKLHAPGLTEQLAKYAPVNDEMLARSEQKLQYSKQHDDTPYEAEVHGVTEYKRNKFAPIISLAACAVLVAGIGGIYALQKNHPDISPGSLGMLSEMENVPPFGDISGLELWFTDNDHPTYDTSYTISAEQQAALAEAFSACTWETFPVDEVTNFNVGTNYITMHYYNPDDTDKCIIDSVRFGLNANMVVWDSIDRHTGDRTTNAYKVDETLMPRILEIMGMQNEIIASEDQRYLLYSALSSSYHFDMFNLNEADILFMTENSAPEYYTIPPAQKMQLAEYFSNREAWENAPKDLMGYDNPETGEKICMFFSDENYKTIVTFWSDGYITEQASGSGTIGWWKTKPEMFSTVKMLTEKRQDSFTLPYTDYAEVMANRDAALETVFGEKGAPFGDVSEESMRGMCTAYAPYVSEFPDSYRKAIAEAFNNAIWREVDPDTTFEDGETDILYVWNGGEPYTLVFYSYNLVKWENGTEQRKFRTSVDVSLPVNQAINYPEVHDHVTWVEPSDNMNSDVWKAVNAAAAEADLSAYEAVLDEFNHKHRVHWKIVTPEDQEPGEGITVRNMPLYADVIAEILAMTPEEYGAYLEGLYAGYNPSSPSMPYLDGDFTVSYRDSDGTETVLTLTEEERAELTALVNDTYWEISEHTVKFDVQEQIRDEGTALINAFVIQYDNLTLTVCPEEHLAVWFADIDENLYSNGYFETWDELEHFLQGFIR